MEALSKNLVRLADVFAEHRQVKTWRVGHLAAGRGGFFERLRQGGRTSTQRFEVVMLWFSANWPSDLPWPEDIPRPGTKKMADVPPANPRKQVSEVSR